MHRILIHIPLHLIGYHDIPIYAYGFMMMVGFAGGILIVTRLARAEGIRSEAVYNISLCGILSGIVGARVLWIFLFAPQDKPLSLLQMAAVWNGGLVFYGGLLFALLTCCTYVRLKKLPLARLADAFAPGLAFGLACGRVGCFLNGCCFGARCDPAAWYAVTFPPGSPAATHHLYAGWLDGGPSLPVYPAQLFAAAASLLIMAALLLYHRYRRPFPGSVLLLFVQLYAVARFLLEYIRDDTPVYWPQTFFGGFNAGQVVALLTFIGATVLRGRLGRSGRGMARRRGRDL